MIVHLHDSELSVDHYHSCQSAKVTLHFMMSTTKKGASGADERAESYKSDTTETTSRTKFGDDVYSYTRVSKISQGFFDNDDLALRHYDEAKDTFTALEAAYKRLLLQVEATKEERRFEVNFICSFIR